MTLLTIFYLLAGLGAFGLAVWALTTYVPMSPGIKTAIRVAAVCVVVFVLLRVFGVFDALARIRV